MNNAELLDNAIEHFSNPKNEPSVMVYSYAIPSSTGLDANIYKTYDKCLYRRTRSSLDPCRCAIGASIPDEKYYPEMEEMDLETLMQSLGWYSVTYQWALQVQSAHDMAAKRGRKAVLDELLRLRKKPEYLNAKN
jgi:hypothetical protein